MSSTCETCFIKKREKILNSVNQISNGKIVSDNLTLPKANIFETFKFIYTNEEFERESLLNFARSSSSAEIFVESLIPLLGNLSGDNKLKHSEPQYLGKMNIEKLKYFSGEKPSFLHLLFPNKTLFWSNVNIFIKNCTDYERINLLQLNGNHIILIPSSVDPKYLEWMAKPKKSNFYRICVITSLNSPPSALFLFNFIADKLKENLKFIIDSNFNDSNIKIYEQNLGNLAFILVDRLKTRDLAELVLTCKSGVKIIKTLGYAGNYPLFPKFYSDYTETKVLYSDNSHPTITIIRGRKKDLIINDNITYNTNYEPKYVKVLQSDKKFKLYYPKYLFTLNDFLLASDQRLIIVDKDFSSIEKTNHYKFYDKNSNLQNFSIVNIDNYNFYVPFTNCPNSTNPELNAIVGYTFRL